MSTIEHLRDISALHPLRGRRCAVVVCADDAASWAPATDELAALDAELVVEGEPGPLSQRLGRPSVTVTDRFLDVALRGEQLDRDEVLKTIRWLEMRCEECPQSRIDMAPHGTRGGWV